VSVLAVFKENGVTKGLSTIVEGESVFNDGIGVVVYLIILQAISGQDASAGAMAQVFFWEVFAGAGVGLFLGYLTHLILGKIDDNLIEVLLSLILAYGAYLLAQRLHCSGVVAVVCAGLIIGNYGRILSMSAKTRVTLNHFWEVLSFAVNSLLFLIIGMDLESTKLLNSMPMIVGVFLFMVAARSVTVYGLTSLVGVIKKSAAIPLAWKHVANWGGLRGSIPIALALGLPAGLYMRDQIVTLIFGVVLLSLLFQGLTIKMLLSKLGLIGTGAQADFEKSMANRIAVKAAIRELRIMHSNGEISDSIYDDIIDRLQARDQEVSLNLALLYQEDESVRESMEKKIAKRLGYAEHTALQQAFLKGLIGDHTLEKMIDDIAEDIDLGIIGVLEDAHDQDSEKAKKS
jgi:CPA1 family monovalent cation:H+ antiporter